MRAAHAVLLGGLLAAGSMVVAYVVWAAGVRGPVAIVVWVVCALIGLTGAGLTLRDRDRG